MNTLIWFSRLEFDLATPLLESRLSASDYALARESLLCGTPALSLMPSNPQYIYDLRRRVSNIILPFLNSFFLPFGLSFSTFRVYSGLRFLVVPSDFVHVANGSIFDVRDFVSFKNRVLLAKSGMLPGLDFLQVCSFAVFTDARIEALRYVVCQGMTLEVAGGLCNPPMSRQNVSLALKRFMSLLLILDQAFVQLRSYVVSHDLSDKPGYNNKKVCGFIGDRVEFLKLLDVCPSF